MRQVKNKEIGEVFQKAKPERVALITSADNKKKNVMTAEWFMRTSFNPPLVAISIGKTRYSHGLIKNQGEFVLAFPNSRMVKDMLICGTKSGRDTDKFEETNLVPKEGAVVKAPLIENCVLNLECKIINSLETGDHTIFVGEIVAAHEGEGEILLEFKGKKFGGLSDYKKR